MDYTRRRSGITPACGAGGTALAFAAFVLAHDGCGGTEEVRLDDGSLACWCLPCDELRVFGAGAPPEGGVSAR